MQAGRIGQWLAAAVLVAVMAAPCAQAQSSKANGLEVLVPPRPDYPVIAAEQGLAGRCELKFSMNDYVLMQIESVSCSSPEFCTPTVRAMSKAEFLVVDAPGTSHPGKREDIVYPMVYALSDSDEAAAEVGALPVAACTRSAGY